MHGKWFKGKKTCYVKQWMECAMEQLTTTVYWRLRPISSGNGVVVVLNSTIILLY